MLPLQSPHQAADNSCPTISESMSMLGFFIVSGPVLKDHMVFLTSYLHYSYLSSAALIVFLCLYTSCNNNLMKMVLN